MEWRMVIFSAPTRTSLTSRRRTRWRSATVAVAALPRIAAEEGLEIADAIGDRFVSRGARWALAWARMVSEDLASAVAQFRAVADEAAAYGDATWAFAALFHATQALCHLGDIGAARICADAVRVAAGDLGSDYDRYFAVLKGYVALAAGDVDAAQSADEEAWRDMSHDLSMVKISLWRRAAVALARGDLVAARRWADEAVSATAGWHRGVALTTRAMVAIAQGDTQQAERDAHAALALEADVNALLGVPDTFECLAVLACEAGNHPDGARLFGAAQTIRQQTGEVRFQIYQAAYDGAIDSLRKAMEQNDFENAWAEGAKMSAEEAIAYAKRGRGERKRPSSGWESLTPAEHDVVRPVCEGLGNKEIAARLFVSPRTVQEHLAHVYTKLSINSRVQLVQEAARRAQTSVE
jgi:DNA-binding CsgD family transcriptional regulator